MNNQIKYKSCTVSGGCKVYKGPWGPANIDVIMQRVSLKGNPDYLENVCLELLASGKIRLIQSALWDV